MSTCHKYQGGRIEGEYAILELNQYTADRNLVYTSITRCTDYKNIHINHSELKQRYFPTIHPLEPKDITTKVAELSLYKIVYDCKCPEEIKKEYVIADSNHELTKMTAAVRKSHGINQKHSKCECCITPLIKATMMNKHMQKCLAAASGTSEGTAEARPQPMNIIKDFKPIINTRYEPKIYHYSDSNICIYYDDNLEKKKKKVNTTRCGEEAGKQKMNRFLEENKLLTLSFSC